MLAVAEMYIKGVFHPGGRSRDARIRDREPVFGRRSAAPPSWLDEELQAWRDRPLGEIKYLILDARYEKDCATAGLCADVAVLSAHRPSDG